MTTTPPEAPGDSTELPPEYTGGPRVTREDAKDLGRIRRSLTDRKIGGVAGGIARHFDVDPLLVRVALVLLAFFGGGGILIYAAGWLLIPDEGSDEGTIRVDDRTRTLILTVVAAIAALSLVGDSFGGWSFPWPLAIIGLVIAGIAAASRPRPHPGPLPAEGWISAGMRGEVPGAQTATRSTYPGYQPGPRPTTTEPRRRGPILFWFTLALATVAVIAVGTAHLAGWDGPVAAYPAAVLASCGVMLLVAAFYGRGGGLIFIGLVAAVATLVASAVEDVSAGQIDTLPTTAEAVDDRYSLGAGEIILDLTAVEDLENLGGRTLDVEVRLGHILVIVPEEGLDVTVDADIQGGGESVVFDERTDGSLKGSHDPSSGDEPELHLDLEVLFGQIEVETKEAA